MARIENFLTRNAFPHHLLDPATDREAQEIIARYAPQPTDLPLVVAPDGTVLRNPDEHELAHALGMIRADRPPTSSTTSPSSAAGPAGLSTAVYAGSEGLSVIVLDQRAFGGQAGASARIENYFGFPTGISGQALAGRAFVQAQKFGSEIMIPVAIHAARLLAARTARSCSKPTKACASARARVVIASGARYRRPAVDNLVEFEGRGVWYWASPIEARLCADEEVIAGRRRQFRGPGGGVSRPRMRRKVRMMVRGDGLAATMSRYLIDRIAAAPNIEVMPHTEVIGLEGEQRPRARPLEATARPARRADGAIRNLFLFIGADPATGWLEGLRRRSRPFRLRDHRQGMFRRQCRESRCNPACRGVFAVGDVRAGSVKRVGGAIGEGAQVVAAIHRYLARRRMRKRTPMAEAVLHASRDRSTR